VPKCGNLKIRNKEQDASAIFVHIKLITKDAKKKRRNVIFLKTIFSRVWVGILHHQRVISPGDILQLSTSLDYVVVLIR
jgi:hypothetical protein